MQNSIKMDCNIAIKPLEQYISSTIKAEKLYNSKINSLNRNETSELSVAILNFTIKVPGVQKGEDFSVWYSVHLKKTRLKRQCILHRSKKY